MGKGYLEMAIYGIKRFNKKSREKLGEIKFIRLVNEYLGDKQNWLYCRREIEDGIYDSFFHTEDGEGIIEEAQIISKSFGFIEWLVENDKIDLLQLDNRIALSEFNKVERVLMALSISDTPIDDLISYLK